MAAAATAKTWRATLNNFTETELDNIRHWDCSRMVVAKEIGESGTPHLQIFVTFGRTYRLSALKKLLPRAHWEQSMTADWNYEHKGDSEIVHRVDNRKTGKRTDLEKAYEYAHAKRTMREYVVEQKPGLQAIKHYRELYCILEGPRPVGPVDVRWYYGPTGSGKTRSAYDEFPGLYPCATYKWWDGYVDQETILIDDFRPEWCRWEQLLQLLDIYPIRIEFKGGSKWAQWKRIIITAPVRPETMFSGKVAEDLGQLLRRITDIRRFRIGGEGGPGGEGDMQFVQSSFDIVGSN